MTGYLDQYGAGDERREKVRRIWALAGLALALLAGVFYFTFHYVFPNRRQQSQVKQFFERLAARDYKAAYAFWGCTDAQPCRDYPIASFLRDWGPEALTVTSFEVLDGESCGSGVIVDVDAGQAGDRRLWVERDNLLISFPPVSQCPQRDRIYDMVRNARYRLRGRTYKQ